jgi:hypothetical protein
MVRNAFVDFLTTKAEADRDRLHRTTQRCQGVQEADCDHRVPLGVLRGRGHHQNYLKLHPAQPYIVYNDLPKLDALKQLPELIGLSC